MANLYDKASLVLPTSPAYKDGVIQAYKPLTSEGTFDFSRGSNLAATRVNEDGLIEKGRENLVLQSNQFDITWVNTNSSVTSGQSGYDGSSDAWQVAISAAFAQVEQNVSNSGVQTFSVYAKAGTLNWVRLRVDHSGFSGTYFDLQNGVVGTTASDIDSNIEDLGGGWYRCSLTFNNSITKVRIYPAQADNDLTATSGNIYIQDAQLEAGLVATDYIETGATTAQAGILEDLPRIDYSGGASCPALLLEPQRTNLVTQSELVTTSITNVGYTTSENDATSPEGVVNSGKILETTGTIHLVQKTFSVASTTDTYAVSFFIKGIGRTRGTISYELNGAPYNSVSATFNLAEETITDAVALGTGAVAGESGIQPMGNDWYRVTLSGVVGIAGTHFVRLFGRDDSGNTSYVGDPTKGFNVYGFQAEQASYPTSYIPTYGSAVTRNVEKVDGQENASSYNDSEGVLYIEFSALSDTRDNEFRFLISDGTNNERIQIGLQTGGDLYASVIESNSASASFNYTLPNPTQMHKVAIKYKANDCALWVDGVERGTDANVTMPSGLDVFDFYRTPNNNNYVEANVKQVLYFKTALTNAELATLTTL